MKLAAILLAVTTGCSAAASAVGSLVHPKPPSITVVTNVEVPPPPAPAAVTKHDGPGRAIVAGALAGGVAAAIWRTSPEAIVSGAALGAGVGYAVHAMSD